MHADFDLDLFTEELSGLSFDELRELPFDVVARLDLSCID